jgi:hypothetical protein
MVLLALNATVFDEVTCAILESDVVNRCLAAARTHFVGHIYAAHDNIIIDHSSVIANITSRK